MFNWRDRFRAFCIHFLISVCLATVAALLVFFVWYPFPYREISGGRELFLILVSVDVILGPLLTFSIFDRRKTRRALTFDFSMIGSAQLLALCYGLWTVFVARPVHMVFEYDRYRVVHAIEVPEELLPRTPPGIVALPITGPTMLSIRAAQGSEVADVTLGELSGTPASARPDFWQPYDAARSLVLKHAKPISELQKRFPSQSTLINHGIESAGRSPEELLYLPLFGRKEFWTALIDKNTTQVLYAIPLDPY